MTRSILILVLACLAPLAGAAATVEAVDSVSINVSDLDRSITFYRDVLGFRAISVREVSGEDYEHLIGVFGARARIERMQLGDESINLVQYLAPQGRPRPADSHANDRWFQHVAIIVSDMDRAYGLLRDRHVAQASTGPQQLPDWNSNAGGIRAYYFRDPDGNFLELLQFPPDKGDKRWQRRDGTLFLGIDHTAIVVADTDASLAYYRDHLGLRVAGHSENHGIEQERLNNVFGARLRITALRAAHGPGIELLEYLAPQGGRPMPSDTRTNDDWCWLINLSMSDAAAAATELRAARVPLVSGALVELHADDLGVRRAVLARDPDGHVAMLGDSGASHE